MYTKFNSQPNQQSEIYPRFKEFSPLAHLLLRSWFDSSEGNHPIFVPPGYFPFRQDQIQIGRIIRTRIGIEWVLGDCAVNLRKTIYLRLTDATPAHFRLFSFRGGTETRTISSLLVRTTCDRIDNVQLFSSHIYTYMCHTANRSPDPSCETVKSAWDLFLSLSGALFPSLCNFLTSTQSTRSDYPAALQLTRCDSSTFCCVYTLVANRLACYSLDNFIIILLSQLRDYITVVASVARSIVHKDRCVYLLSSFEGFDI